MSPLETCKRLKRVFKVVLSLPECERKLILRFLERYTDTGAFSLENDKKKGM